jgi:hypothetical protein
MAPIQFTQDRNPFGQNQEPAVLGPEQRPATTQERADQPLP